MPGLSAFRKCPSVCCIVRALPSVLELSERCLGSIGGFAFTVQALFFARHVTPFLYFQF